MKKILLGFIVILLVGVSACGSKPHHDKNLTGRTTTIQYEIVNFRESPRLSSGNIIGEISYGERIQLTGKYVEHILDETDASSWVEIEYDGQVGWVVRSAINWMNMR